SERNSVLFEAWLGCGGEWSKSSLYINCKSTSSSVRKGVRRWMTKSELTSRHGEDNAEAIILRKLQDPTLCTSEVKKHPDLPDSLELMQFLCLDSEVQVEKEEEIMSMLYKVAEAPDSSSSDSSSAKKVKKSKKSKKDKDEGKSADSELRATTSKAKAALPSEKS
ncbi:unnamed protein product, partial [Symbiodinium pilosum]